MNRRSFLGNLFKTIAVAAIVPSILLEVQAVEDGWKVYHLDGYTIRMKTMPLFDVIQQFDFPLESYKMLFIDNEKENKE